jgi:hypothetical protein
MAAQKPIYTKHNDMQYDQSFAKNEPKEQNHRLEYSLL